MRREGKGWEIFLKNKKIIKVYVLMFVNFKFLNALKLKF
jgi:hypothetical protein